MIYILNVVRDVIALVHRHVTYPHSRGRPTREKAPVDPPGP
jgi:hypothetical protein